MESRRVTSVLCVSLIFFLYIDLPSSLTSHIKTIKNSREGWFIDRYFVSLYHKQL